MGVFRKLHIAKQLFRCYRRAPLFKLRHESLPVLPHTGLRWLDGGGRLKVVRVYLSIRIAEIVHSFVNPQYWSQTPPLSLTLSQATDKCVWKHGQNKLGNRSTRTSRIFRAVCPCTSFEYIKRKSSDFCRSSAQTNIRIIRSYLSYNFFFFFINRYRLFLFEQQHVFENFKKNQLKLYYFVCVFSIYFLWAHIVDLTISWSWPRGTIVAETFPRL